MYTLLAHIYPNFIYTKMFWKIVKKHFEENPGKPYLCLRSPLFEAYWSENEMLIKKLAKEFQEGTKYKKVSVLEFEGSGFLFWTNSYPIDREVRTYFINWCIRKYSK